MSAPFALSAGRVELAGDRVLDDVDFHVDDGEFVTVLGPNGSGKTTLVRALVGLTPLSSGHLEVFGVPIAQFHERARIGYVPQRGAGPTVVPVSVGELVLAGRAPLASRFRGWSATDREAVRDALSVVGLTDRERAVVGTLSGGQQQRARIARALAARPSVLVLDEPTAGVDTESQAALADTLHRLHDSGTAVLLVAHELGPLESLVDRVVILSQGHVAYDGPDVPPGLHDATHHHMHHPVDSDERPGWPA